MHVSEEKLKGILIQSGVVDEATFKSATDEASRTGHHVTDVLLGNEDISEDYLMELLQTNYGLPVVDLKKITIPKETLELVPESLAKTKNVVLFEIDPKKKLAKVAMRDPLDYETIDFLRFKLDCWIEPYLTTLVSIKYGLKQYSRPMGAQFY